MIFLGVLTTLGLLLGAVFGWVALFKIATLRNDFNSLKRQLESGAARPAHPNSSQARAATSAQPARRDETGPAATADNSQQPDLSLAKTATTPQRESKPSLNVWRDAEFDDVANTNVPDTRKSATAFTDNTGSGITTPVAAAGPTWVDHLKDQWMAWLGGICVGLSGIFLVRYSIEQGYLGPTARIALALLTGMVLHTFAEWSRRRSAIRLQALAALAGGASIILFAALLAALHLYQLLPPLVVFVSLTVVALLTMALAVLHGPIMAILGLLSAYAIPVLVDTGGGSVSSVLAYSLVISAAAMVLMHFVYRYWIWTSMLLGALFWWFVALTSFDAELVRGVYLAALSYLVLAGPGQDWTLTKTIAAQGEGRLESLWREARDVSHAPITISLLFLVMAYAFSIYVTSINSIIAYYWTPQIVLLFLASRAKPSITWFPWLSLCLQTLVWIGLGTGSVNGVTQIIGFAGAEQGQFLGYAGWMAALYFALSLWLYRERPDEVRWLSLALFSPLTWLTLCYLLIPEFTDSWFWGSVAVAIGVVYLGFASVRLKQSTDPEATAWLFLAGHFAYSLAVAIILSEASLTLALSAQFVSLAWVIRRFNLLHLDLLLKLVLAVVVVRLTINPWLLTYPSDIHWSLWTYGGATVFCALAASQTQKTHVLRQWLEAATLHLFVLTLWAETRYALYDGDIFATRFELLEAAINTALWSSLGIVYFIRSKVSENLRPLYVLISKILLALSLIGYIVMLTRLNPYFGAEPVGTTPIFNLLLLAYGFPIVASALVYRLHLPEFREISAAVGAFAAFIFINMQIRHLWQGQLDLDLPTSSGELYTYSVVWLILAVLTMLGGAARYGNKVYRIGVGLLCVVIAKIFLADMADLEGLWRVASFMGLGLCLLGLAYLYQRFNFKHRKLSPVSESSVGSPG